MKYLMIVIAALAFGCSNPPSPTTAEPEPEPVVQPEPVDVQVWADLEPWIQYKSYGRVDHDEAKYLTGWYYKEDIAKFISLTIVITMAEDNPDMGYEEFTDLHYELLRDGIVKYCEMVNSRQ